MKEAYEILEIGKNATFEEAKKKYKELVKRYHPDKHMNNPLKDLAEEKFKKINEAFEYLSKELENKRNFEDVSSNSNYYEKNSTQNKSYNYKDKEESEDSDNFNQKETKKEYKKTKSSLLITIFKFPFKIIWNVLKFILKVIWNVLKLILKVLKFIFKTILLMILLFLQPFMMFTKLIVFVSTFCSVILIGGIIYTDREKITLQYFLSKDFKELLMLFVILGVVSVILNYYNSFIDLIEEW